MALHNNITPINFLLNSKTNLPSEYLKYLKISGNAISLLDISDKNKINNYLQNSCYSIVKSILLCLTIISESEYLVFIQHNLVLILSDGFEDLIYDSTLFITLPTN